jgi:hypothetical protein
MEHHMSDSVLNPKGVLVVRAMIGPTMPLEPVGGPAATPAAELCRKLGFSLATGDATDPVIELALSDQCIGEIELPPGHYVLNLRAQMMAASKELPLIVDVRANEVTELTVAIDLGIR